MAPRVANGTFITLKASLAAAGAAATCGALGVTDVLSASFVAVLSVSPTLVTGLKRAGQQLAASVGAGVLATGWALAPGPTWFHVLGATGTSVGLAFATRMDSAWTTAGFCALYVVALPGEPVRTLKMRLASVGIGALAAFLVNAAVTGPFYGRVFRKRMARLEEALAAAKTEAKQGNTRALEAFEAAARQVDAEIRDALGESRFRPGVPVAELETMHGTLKAWLREALEARASEENQRSNSA